MAMQNPRPRLPQTLLLGRTEGELGWYRRRSLLQAAALWAAAGGGIAAAQAPASSGGGIGNVVDLRGEVLRNGQPLAPQHSVAAGDRIETGDGAMVVFTVGDGAFLVRQRSQVGLEGDTPTAVKTLRLLAGAVASVWGRGGDRRVILPTATAGIRGTGVYAEVFADLGGRSYFCNCYGTVDLAAGSDSVASQAEYHQSFWVETTPRNGRLLTPAGAINHTDEEMEFLSSLIGQRTPWQVAGRKGSRDGSGHMDYPRATPGIGEAGSTGSAAGTAPPPASPASAPVHRARPPSTSSSSSTSPYGSDY